MIDSNENKHSASPPKNVDEAHEPKAESKKPDIRECTVHDSISKFKSLHN